MNRKLFSLLFAIVASVGTMFASVTIDGIAYNLNETELTAEVTGGSYSGSIVIPESVTYEAKTYSVTNIEDYAFMMRAGLTTIEIPNSVTSIGTRAFDGCSGLTSIEIPNSVTSIGYGAFVGCSSLTSPIYNAHVLAFMPTTYSGAYTIPDGIESIAGGAFEGCTGLTSVSIPNSVTSIGNRAFEGCSGLTSVEIPNSVTSIGNWAFFECSGLTSPVYNAHVFAYMPTTYSGAYTIPNGIESIAGGAFEVCSSLTSVTIPNSVTSIGIYAFEECSSLTIIDIPNSVTNIERQAFNRCTGLTSVTIGNSVTNIGKWAFQYCSGLTSITIPSSVTSIGLGANNSFKSCNGISSIVVNSENTEYDSRDNCNAIIETATNTLFFGCESTIIPSSVTSIGYQAFSGCIGLTSVTIPNSVTSIGGEAFEGCSGMTSVEIPNSVTSIGVLAFSGCTSLTAITCETSNPPTLGNHVFKNVDKSIPLYVPAASVSAYQAADGWSEFTNILPIPAASFIITANEDPEHAGTYYSTFYYSSADYELPAAGVEAFVATISGSDMNLTRIASGAGVIPQGTAVILKSTIQNYTLTLSEDAPVFEGTNALQGVDEATNTPSNCYVLSAVDGVVGFYQYTGEQVGAHKAYLVYNGAGAPRRMRFVFDEENAVTGVEEAGSETANAVRSEKCIENGQLIIEANGVLYNAQGQKVK